MPRPEYAVLRAVVIVAFVVVAYAAVHHTAWLVAKVVGW